MKKHEKVWGPETRERARLSVAADTITAYSISKVKATVRDVYLDAGQGWKHTSIIVDDGRIPYQIGFVELDDIMSGNAAQFDCAVDYICNDVKIPYFDYRRKRCIQ